MSLHHLLCDAIASRRLLLFAYGDRVRLVEPHLYGESAAGHGVLSAWLRPGFSRSTPEGGWRLFRLDGMHDVQAVDETFARPRPGYHPPGMSLATVWCALPEFGAAPATHAEPPPVDDTVAPAPDAVPTTAPAGPGPDAPPRATP
jgi:hypothetical protein